MSQDLDSLYDESDEQLRTGTLSFSKEPQERSRTKSWGDSPLALNMDGEEPNLAYNMLTSKALKVQIVSAQTVEEVHEKKYVAYTVKFRKDHGDGKPDPSPAYIERRYTDFLDLYNSLRREQPALMHQVSFPKKVFTGNFGPDVIQERRLAFENFLRFVPKEDKLRLSPSFVAFLQGHEQREANTFLRSMDYERALPLLENSFKLVNKIYTERHPVVIIALCRLVACSAAKSEIAARAGGPAERYAEMALRRFEGISDSDLLRFYVPLLQLCVHLWWVLGKDKQVLSDRLECLKRRGIKVDGCDSLFDATIDAIDL